MTAFHIADGRMSTHSSLVRHDWGQERAIFEREAKVMVPHRTIDQAVAELQLHSVDCVKIDVEGTEADVVRGMRRTLRENRPREVMCETTVGSRAFEALAEHYDEIWIIDDRGQAIERAAAPVGKWGNVFFSRQDGRVV